MPQSPQPPRESRQYEPVASQATEAAPTRQSGTLVVDKEVTPPPKMIAPEESTGWRTALAPLPAALRPGTPDSTTNLQEQANSSARVGDPEPRPIGTASETARGAEPNSLPDLPIAPVPAMNSFGMQGSAEMRPAPLVPQAPASEPARFMLPSVASAGRRVPLVPDGEAMPPTRRMTPTGDKNLQSLDSAEDLAKQTDSIRIIPGYGPAPAMQQLKPIADGSLDDAVDPTADAATGGKTGARWTPNTATAANPAAPNAVVVQDAPNAGGRRAAVGAQGDNRWTDSVDQRAAAQQQTAPNPERRSSENQPSFDLATLVSTPEFREIHTAPVLEGLELLARREPRHRALGAMRIAAAGPDARTALPVLRRVLAVETDKAVQLRIAETVLKLQPNDRLATECLSDLLADRDDWELRQYAASAFAGAASGRNAIAIARLTDALDDANPSVRTRAATTLGLFGPAAADSVPRLEGAAVNDVPSVQRAASLSLASIRGEGSEWPAGESHAARPNDPFGLKPLNSMLSSPLHAAGVSGRVKLSDQPSAWETGDSDVARLGPDGTPPKLFPADRMGGTHLLAPAPEIADDDAVPTNATDADAPLKQPPTPAPAALPPGLNPPQPPIAPAATPQPTTTSSFLLQSEAGASKSGSKP